MLCQLLQYFTTAMAKQAPVLWAQREDCIYLTVEVPDVKDPKVDIQGTTFAFK